MRVALLGVGRIGTPVVGRLVAAGHGVRAFDVRPDRQDAVEAGGATWAASAIEATSGADIVLTVLPGSPELRALMLDDAGLLGQLSATWVDLTSASPELGRELAIRAAERGIGYLDAPVGGGVAAARDGRLTLYVGGDRTTLDVARPVLSAFADPDRIVHLGPSGSGYLVKLLVNLLWFGQAVTTAEALLLARRAGLDVRRLREVLLAGPAASEFLRSSLPSALDGDYLTSFGLDRCVEELDAIEAAARDHGTPFDVSAAIAKLHRDALAHFGPVAGELMGIAYLEHRAGTRLDGGTAGNPA